MKTVICSGSFDPVTVGHIDIITRASKMFDKIIVAVLHNMNKQACFTAEERVRLLEKATSDLPNVEVTSFDGLLADFAAQKNATAILNMNFRWHLLIKSLILSLKQSSLQQGRRICS